ncbi:hypothetical protein [uncultured Rikenella sp.]|uniref:hypothetical protein n=1 Tax=uncultured Rikenella sp. TaxID=368003 RepID=UPI0026154600|nr:hypothetical protein [uncultured Rikenella sp.]
MIVGGLTSCGNPVKTKNENRINEQITILTTIVNNCDTTQSKAVSAINQIKHLNAVIDSVLIDKQGYSMFYLLNSGCSVCIGQLLDFCNILGQTDLKIPLYIIPVSRHHVPLIEYYLEQGDSSYTFDRQVIRHSLPGNAISALNKTVVVTHNNRIIEQFIFE